MTDYTKICRVCLGLQTEKTGHLLPINKTRIHLGTISLLDAMRLFIDVELTKDERLPQSICASCVKDITGGYVFKLKCEAAEKFLNEEILNSSALEKAMKKDACTSTADLAEYYEDDESERPTKKTRLQRQCKDKQQDKPVPCKVEPELIEIVNENIENTPCDPTYTNDNEVYKQFSQNGFEVVKDPVSGQNVFSINLTPYTLTNPYETKYSEYVSSTNDQMDYNHPYVSNIKHENPVTVNTENIEHIIEKAEYVMESEMPSLTSDYPNEADEEINDDVLSPGDSKPIKRRRRTRRSRNMQRTTPLVSNTLECVACAEKHETLDKLKKHFFEKHIHGQFCTVCNKEYDRNGSMKRHVNAHFKVEKVQCPICSREFLSENALVNHRTRDHVTFNCPECHLTLETHEEYVSHVSLHVKQPEEALASNKNAYELKQLCQFCNQLFDGILGLKDHFQREHTEKNHCKVCNIMLLSTASLKSHIHEHCRKRDFRCTACKKRFAKSATLKVHNVEVHNGYDICKYCLLELGSREEFEKHEMEHEMQGTIGCFQCRICGITTSSNLSLLNHQVVHEQNIECSTCYHSFRKETDYKKHMALGHKMKCEPKCKLCRFKVPRTPAER